MVNVLVRANTVLLSAIQWLWASDVCLPPLAGSGRKEQIQGISGHLRSSSIHHCGNTWFALPNIIHCSVQLDYAL